MKKRNVRPRKLLWIDLEMTGLEPDQQRIIEVGLIITDFDFNEIASYEAVIHQDESVLDGADEWVKTNFTASGLFKLVRESETTEEEVKEHLLKLIEEHFDEPVILAGSSIHQDRRFIRKWWPEIEEKLHYRMLDVSSLKVFMMGAYNVRLDKNEDHRALGDIRGSIAELRYYIDWLRSENNKQTNR